MSKKIYGRPVATPINPRNLVPDVSEDINKALEEAKASGAFKGEPGYTPVKGKDYFDGEPGYTPVKGKDYFDGAPGTPGKTAYQYARDAGYTGTEEEFAEHMANDSSGEAFYITISGDSVSGYTTDKTGAEINAAYTSGRMLYCKCNGHIMSLVSAGGAILPNQPKVFRFAIVTETIGYSASIKYTKSSETTEATASTYVVVTHEMLESSIKPASFVVTVSYEDGSYVADTTFAEILRAHNAGHVVSCLHDDVYYRMVMMEPDAVYFLVDSIGVSDYLVIHSDNTVESIRYNATVKINDRVWDGEQSVDFTETINEMIDAKSKNGTIKINGQTWNGEQSADFTDTINSMIDAKGNDSGSVKGYGAVGDGSTDDTKAFTDSLSANRVVKVPGGTYKLSGTLVIRENCCLELSQDTVLKFTKTSGNCIEMRSSAVLRGNHATIIVPYALTGNAISMDTTQDGTDHNSIPPRLAAGSHMSKRQRFIYDINILKPDSSGICKSTDGKCNGTAIYMSAEGTASFRWMWVITMSGIRIAGGFSYGIRAVNYDKAGDYADNAWNHDMRIEAAIENCEIGVALENCNGARLDVTIQPHATESGVKYAKHGVYLNDARFIDMIGSRVWDWNEKGTLWTSGGQYQHIAMIGNCRGLLLDDFLFHESSTDIRNLIYTDTPANFDTMRVLQESGGNSVSVQQDYIKRFTDVLTTATDGNGNVFEGKGYVKSGYNIQSDGSMVANGYYGCTGFIRVKPGDTVYVHGIVLGAGDGSSNFSLYDSSFAKVANINSANAQFQAGNNYYYHYTALDNGFKVVVAPNNDPAGATYLRFSYLTNMVKDTPMVAINEEIQYTQANFLSDDIKINGENIIGGASSGFGYVENKLLFPETELTLDEDYGYVMPEMVLVAGNTYEITYNGTKYTCKAVNVDGLVAVGNYLLEESGEPFTVGYVDGFGCLMEPLDEPETVTVKIEGEVVTKIDPKFYDSGVFWVDVLRDGDYCYTVITPNTLLTAVNAGRPVIARYHGYLEGVGNAVENLNLVWYVQNNPGELISMAIFESSSRSSQSAGLLSYCILGAGDDPDEPYTVDAGAL